MPLTRRQLLAASAGAPLASAAGGPRPNIVLMLADDLGWGDVGYHGGPIDTPNIDSLAKGGVRFTQFYSFPLCSPTRAALLTGRNPIRYGLTYSVVRPWSPYGLDPGETTLAEAFRSAGYQTAIIGKWHLGHTHVRLLPRARGFDHFYGHLNGAIDYYTHERDGGIDWQRNGTAVREPGYSTDLLAAEAVRVIEQRDPSRPFFLYLPWNAPHSPHQAPEALVKKYASIPNERRRLYCAMVDALDTGVGRVTAALDRLGLRDNTLVLFLSDNGGPLQGGATNGPLRAGKATVFEGGIRVPAIFNWRGVLEPAQCTQTATVLDLFPTLLAAAGVSHSLRRPLDGEDVWAGVRGAPPRPRRNLFFAVAEGGPRQHALRDGDWKLVRHEARLGEPPREWLFDVGRDPEEKQDQLPAHPEIAAGMRSRLKEWAALHPDVDVLMSLRPHPGWIPPRDWSLVAAE